MKTTETRKKRYEVVFCPCGTIHFLPWDEITHAVDEGKELVYICSKCGAASKFGGTDYWDGKALYRTDLPSGTVIDKSDFEDIRSTGHSPFTKIIYSEGYRVLMMTGNYANFFSGGIFYDTDNPLSMYQLQSLKTYDKIIEYYKNWQKKSTQVNMNWLINHIKDDELEYLKGYVIEGLKWEDVE